MSQGIALPLTVVALLLIAAIAFVIVRRIMAAKMEDEFWNQQYDDWHHGNDQVPSNDPDAGGAVSCQLCSQVVPHSGIPLSPEELAQPKCLRHTIGNRCGPE